MKVAANLGSGQPSYDGVEEQTGVENKINILRRQAGPRWDW